MKTRQTGTAAILLVLGLCSASDAEYLIYLKGGHFIVADDCTFAAPQEIGTPDATDAESTPVEDCTQGKPQEGRIFWSTINENRGEVNADDVYAILGSKSLPPIKPSGAALPLEDYLITNRGESFVNAKTVEQKDVEVYGLKRDELAKVNRRGVIGIDPEHLAKSRSGEGLCPKEPPEFTVGEVEIVDGHLLGSVTNLSKEPWRPELEAEVRVKGHFLGKFKIEDSNVLDPNEDTSIDSLVPSRFLKELERLKDAGTGVRLCYRKVKPATKKVNR